VTIKPIFVRQTQLRIWNVYYTRIPNVCYIPTYAQISTVNLYYITPTCFGVNTPSSGSLQLCWLKLWIIKMTKYNIVLCCYDKMLVNVAAYVIPG
jgi:hypothetical protein